MRITPQPEEDAVEEKNKEDEGRIVTVNLVHERQKYSWDCGVACVLMVLGEGTARTHLSNNLGTVCREEGFGRSTWTIDLCYLLKKYGVRHQFSTVTLGIHPSYFGHSFYSGILKRDAERVAARFTGAVSAGLNVQCRREPLDALLAHVMSGRPIIVLTNARLLRCDYCKVNRLGAEVRRRLRLHASYQGHYVVVCGNDPRPPEKLFYRNPSLPDHICRCSYDVFEEARRSYGTDEDIIFIE